MDFIGEKQSVFVSNDANLVYNAIWVNWGTYEKHISDIDLHKFKSKQAARARAHEKKN